MATQCRSCGAPIEWGVTTKTGRLIPINPTTSPDGNITVVGSGGHGRPLVMVLTPDEIALARRHGIPALFTSHFATCPESEQWRRRKPTETEGVVQ